MKIHTPYQQIYKRNPDFIVEYVFDPCDEMKHTKPSQGMRVDFRYQSDGLQSNQVYMIWPELLDKQGNVIRDITPRVIDTYGLAHMWVVNPDMRTYHANRIQIGEKGSWVCGSYRLANVIVTEIGSLNNLQGEE